MHIPQAGLFGCFGFFDQKNHGLFVFLIIFIKLLINILISILSFTISITINNNGIYYVYYINYTL